MARAHQHHHTVPATYLRAFASKKARDKKPKVGVLDLRSGEWRRQRPETLCRRRGFYKVTADGIDANRVELDILTKLEDAAAPLIRRLDDEAIRDPRSVPVLRDVDRKLLDEFTAMMFVRTDHARGRVDRFAHELARSMLSRYDEATFEAVKEKISEDTGMGLALEFDELAAAAEGMEFTVDRNFAIHLMLATFRMMVELLHEHAVSILIAGGREGLLITSNHPAACYRKFEEGPILAHHVTDPRDENCGILMPLSPRVLVRYDKRIGPEVRRLRRGEVANCNSSVASPQVDLVFAHSRDFEFWDGRRIRSAIDFPAVAKEWRRIADENEGARVRDKVGRLVKLAVD